jgi:hypothetical protein
VFDKDQQTVLSTLAELNDALRKVEPEITGISSSMMETPGTSLHFMNLAIAQTQGGIYDGLTRGDLLTELRPELATVIDTEAPTFTYDTHGDKHFPGGPQGTKFSAAAGTVNPILEGIILPNIGRIRRNANGANATYYLTQAGINECPNGQDLTIQVDFIYNDYAIDTISYHGYPDDSVTRYSLARDKGGTDI